MVVRVVETRETQLISIDLMIAWGGRLGGAAHGDTAMRLLIRRDAPDVGTRSRRSHLFRSS